MATKAETLAKEKKKFEPSIEDDDNRDFRVDNMNRSNIQADLSIDQYKLDVECVSHSSLYFRYAEAAHHAKVRVNELEDKLKLILSEQNINIRNDLIQQGVKFTESVIEAELTKDEKVQKAKMRLRDAQRDAGTLSVAVSAFEHRKSELDNLVRLYTSGYWSQPSGSRENSNDLASQEIRRNLKKDKTTAIGKINKELPE